MCCQAQQKEAKSMEMTSQSVIVGALTPLDGVRHVLILSLSRRMALT